MSTVQGTAQTTGHRAGATPRGRALLWGLAWLAVAAVIVLPFVHSFTKLSFIDELQHVDYLVKTQHLEHVNGGEQVGQTALREEACRGTDLQGATLPPCGRKHYDPNDYPGLGFNHTYGDPPLYYVVTAPLAWLAQEVTGLDSVVTAGRSIGVLWLGAGLAVTCALALRLGASRRAAVGATLLVGSTPAVVLATGTITTDAPQLLIGGAMCLAALAVLDGRLAWWWLAPIGAVATATKVTALPAVGAVAVLLLWSWWLRRHQEHRREREERRPPGRELPALAALLAGAVASLAAWNLYSSATALASVDDIPMGQDFKVSHLTWAALSDGVPRLLSPVRFPSAPDFMMGDTVMLVLHLTDIVLIAACFALAWFGSHALPAARLALGATAAMLLSAPAFLVVLYVTMHVSYWIPGRYGLSVLPAAAAVLAVAAGRRSAGGTALLCFGALSLVALLAETW